MTAVVGFVLVTRVYQPAFDTRGVLVGGALSLGGAVGAGLGIAGTTLGAYQLVIRKNALSRMERFLLGLGALATAGLVVVLCWP